MPNKPLTSRQSQVLALYGREGMNVPQIAGALGLSPRTVRKHLRNAMRKLGAISPAQAVYRYSAGGAAAIRAALGER